MPHTHTHTHKRILSTLIETSKVHQKSSSTSSLRESVCTCLSVCRHTVHVSGLCHVTIHRHHNWTIVHQPVKLYQLDPPPHPSCFLCVCILYVFLRRQGNLSAIHQPKRREVKSSGLRPHLLQSPLESVCNKRKF